MTDTWVPVARFTTPALATGPLVPPAADQTTQTIGWAGRNIQDGEVCGVSVTANSSNGVGHAVRIRLYTEDPGVNLMYDTTIDLSDPVASGTDTLAMPIPLFPQLTTDSGTSPSVHSYTVQDINGNGTQTYSVLFFIRATT